MCHLIDLKIHFFGNGPANRDFTMTGSLTINVLLYNEFMRLLIDLEIILRY
jgi:hypothetical protein